MTPVAGRQAVTTLRPRGAGAGAGGSVATDAHPRLTYAILAEHGGFMSLSAVAVAVLLLLTRSAWFWRDEWFFVLGRSFTDPATWFLPHAEHLVAGFAAVYAGLLAVFGTTTYLPFLLVLFAAHIAFAGAIYTLIDRHVGRGPALAAAAVVLFLGSAAFNLSWAFQMGAIGSGALAMWGVVVVRERPRLAATLMGLGVATSGFALFIVPAAALYGWSRRSLVACAVPVLVYGSWYVLIGGRAAMIASGVGSPTSPPTWAESLAWLPGGVAASAASLTGLGPYAVIALFVALLLLLRVPRRLAAVGVLALLTEYAILGFVRPGLNVPGGWQYVYFGAAFLALVFASAWPAVPRWARPIVVLLTGIAFTTNVLALFAWPSTWASIMAIPDAECIRCWIP